MNKRKTTGLLFMAAGIALFWLSNHIEDAVMQGREQIARGQQQVNTINTVFSSNQYTRGIGQTITESGQRKINAGILEADYYEGVAGWCRIGGIASFVVGAFFFFIPSRKR